MERMIPIDIKPELESQLREQAARQGVNWNVFVAENVAEHVARALWIFLRDQQKQPAPCLPNQESRLLEQINSGLPEESWRRYHELTDKRRAESLTSSEHSELISLSDRVEALNARRMESLAELSRLRKTTLTALADELGIKSALDE